MTQWGHLLAARTLMHLAKVARRWGKRRLAHAGGGLWLTRSLLALADGLVLRVARHAVRAVCRKPVRPRSADRATWVLATLSMAALALTAEVADKPPPSQALAGTTVLCLLTAAFRWRDPAARKLTEWDISAGLCFCTAILGRMA